jgi:hypothetical protein
MLNTFGLKTKLRRDKKYNYQECAIKFGAPTNYAYKEVSVRHKSTSRAITHIYMYIKFGTPINYATVSSHKLVHRSSPLDHKQKKGLCAAYNNIELTLAF